MNLLCHYRRRVGGRGGGKDEGGTEGREGRGGRGGRVEGEGTEGG